IVDLLRLAPGMLVNYDSGHIANAGYQFLFDRYRVRFQVLVDGNSVSTPILGEMPWTQLGITIDDIERIEVIRGASSASYGPNAMTGVINIISRHPVLDKGVKFKLNEGVNGRSEQYVTIGDGKGNFDYRLSLNARKDDGFKQRYDSKELAVANFRGDYQASNNDTLTFSLSHNSGDYQEDVVDYLDPSVPDHVKRVTRSSLSGKWTHNFSSSDVFTLNYYQQKYEDKNSYYKGVIFYDESVTTNRKNLELIFTKYSDSYSFALGSLYRIDNTIAPQYLYQVDKDIHTKQYFINTETKLNKNNIINAGLLYDNNDTGGSTTSPRIAFNHKPSKNHTVRLSYAEASRSPFAFEEYTNYVVNLTPMLSDLSDLKSELVTTYDIGYIGSLNNNTTELDMRIYKTNLSKIIVLDTVSGGFNQGGDFDITGFEATFSHKFSSNTRAILNYARTKITAGNIVYGTAADYETGAPENSGSLLIMHNFSDNLKGSLGYYYTGEYQQLCCEVQQQAPRDRLDITLSKAFKWNTYNSKVKLVLQNVTNEKTDTILFNNYHRQGYISFSMEL
ncbi:MAG: TonB-dependent receptor plug domain-containing protein, partial [Gammaproteobacteria bacterium]|nr:TonB-dependent receptor plug domain-containing protein [Gammaproteobacteria bacterium]